MKSSKTFNNISAKLRSEIPKLKPGETVVFQMLHGVPNPEPDERERSKSPMLFGKRQVQTNFRIYDPYQNEIKDEDGKVIDYDGGYVDVGVVEQWNNETPIKFRTFVPGMGEYAQFQGKFQVTGGRIQDEELFEVLYLSNEREGNPHRDTTVEPLFRIINTKADNKATVTKVDKLIKAITTAKEMSLEDAAAVMASLNQPTYQDPEVLRPKVLQFAKDNVDEFLTACENPDNATSLILRRAVEAGIVTHDVVTGDVRSGNVLLTSIRVSTLNEFLPRFTEWTKSAANGKDVLANLKNQVENKKGVAT